jgi:hypothetical protein
LTRRFPTIKPFTCNSNATCAYDYLYSKYIRSAARVTSRPPDECEQRCGGPAASGRAERAPARLSRIHFANHRNRSAQADWIARRAIESAAWCTREPIAAGNDGTASLAIASTSRRRQHVIPVGMKRHPVMRLRLSQGSGPHQSICRRKRRSSGAPGRSAHERGGRTRSRLVRETSEPRHHLKAVVVHIAALGGSDVVLGKRMRIDAMELEKG